MVYEVDVTHDPARTSWVESANEPHSDFPIQNLPYCCFRRREGATCLGVGIGDRILNLRACVEERRLTDELGVLLAESLNPLMSTSVSTRRMFRREISELLDASRPMAPSLSQRLFVRQDEIEFRLPCSIGDFSDFYASLHHATNVGLMFRPDNPLMPNYHHIPIAYHGRSSSIIVSGTNVRRPIGQKSPNRDGEAPPRGPTRRLDYELEVGFYIGRGNPLGCPISMEQAESHLFGICLLNDWSARDIQKWEYQPLGPFLSKSFATSVSPWIVTMEALAPFRCGEFARPESHPPVANNLRSEENTAAGGIDVSLEVYVSSQQMREREMTAVRVSQSHLAEMYWTAAQLVTHHTSAGCNLRAGDLLGSGTQSGPNRDQRGSMLELTWKGDVTHPLPGTQRAPIVLPTGEQRHFLEDGDEVLFQGFCDRPPYRRIGLGDCRGMVLPPRGVEG